MMNIEQFTELLGWTLVINSIVLLFTTVALAIGRSFIVPIHTKTLGIGEAELLKLYANYLSYFKIAVILFSFSPYIALKVMGY